MYVLVKWIYKESSIQMMVRIDDDDDGKKEPPMRC